MSERRPRGAEPKAPGDRSQNRSGADPVGGTPAFERLSGQHAVREALRAQRRSFVRLLLEDGQRLLLKDGQRLPLKKDGRRSPLDLEDGQRSEEGTDLAELARAAGVKVERLPRARFAELAGSESRSQGVLLEAGPLPELPLSALLGGEPGTRRLVALDGVEDPQNVGAVARVAESAGAGGLILTRRRAPPLSPAVSRASAGAIEHLPVARVTNLPRALEELKAGGFWILGAEPEAEADLFGASDRLLSGDLVVVLGAEGRGLRRGVRAVLDHELRIPMAGRVGSLNVSAAAAVLLFELLRRSRLAPPA